MFEIYVVNHFTTMGYGTLECRAVILQQREIEEGESEV
jgi:hypothetical protein